MSSALLELAQLREQTPTLVCDRCGREVDAWPLNRGARCSPKDWVDCIRNDGDYAWSRTDVA